MSDEQDMQDMQDMAMVRAIRQGQRGPVMHEFLCAACAHRDHGVCEQKCHYCTSPCQCVCRRWATPIPGDV